MRTTVTLDADLAARLQQVMRERGTSFKVAINDAVRAGLDVDGRPGKRFRVRAAPLGVRPGINLDKALALAGELEDEEISRKLELRK